MAIYYIKNGGNDALDGLSDANAWATISKVNSFTFSPGDSVLFKKGSTWREYISFAPPAGTAAGRITYSSYGTGNKPLFLGSREESADSDWVDQGSNIWKNVDDYFSYGDGVGNLIFNDEESCGKKELTFGAVDTQGDWFWNDAEGAVYLYSVGNPGTYYSKIECALDRTVINLGSRDYITLDGLDIRYGGYHGIEGASGCDNITIRNCHISYIGGCEFPDVNARVGNGIQFWQAATNILIECNYVEEIYDDAITPQTSTSTDTYTVQIDIINNVIKNCRLGLHTFERSVNSTIEMNWYNNTIIGMGREWGANQRPDSTFPARSIRIAGVTGTINYFNIKNNIFYEADHYLFYSYDPLPAITFDYNLYYNTIGDIAAIDTTVYSTLSSWQAATSQEAHAVGADPLFFNEAGSDYRLSSNSPGVNAGVNVGLTTDYAGRPVSDPPYIGAYDAYSYPKYQLAIYDKYDVSWYTQFFKAGWFGSVITLKGGRTPISFDILNSSDEVFNLIRETNVSLSIIVTKNFMYNELVSPEPMSTYVEVYQSENTTENLYWKGYVDPTQYEEPYDVPPYELKLVCIDGLALLSEIPYAEEDSEGQTEWYTGHQYDSEIILNILSKIGVTEFKEYINLYEDRILDTVSDSPFDQVAKNTDVFSINEMYCDQVLEEVLKKYNASIIMKDGVFCIYRTTDLIQSTAYGRHFTEAFVKSAISHSTLQYISRTDSHISSLRQVPGSKIVGVTPARKIILTQDYGYKDSWIENWKLKGDTFPTGASCFNNWTAGGGWTKLTIANQPDGVVFQSYGGASLPGGAYISQSFGSFGVTEDATFILNFSYLFSNNSGAARSPNIYIKIKADNYSKYLYITDADTKALGWKDTEDYVHFTEADVPEGLGDWNTFEGKFTSLPVPGPFTITLYGAQFSSFLSTVYMSIKDVKFYVTSDALSTRKRSRKDYRKTFTFWQRTRKESTGTPSYKDWKNLIDDRDVDEVVDREYIAINPINGIEMQASCLFGDITDSDIDNIVEQFAGTLVVNLSNLERSAEVFKSTHQLAYTGITLTTEDNVITFTGGEADFSGATSVQSESSEGDLEGDVATVQAFAAGKHKIVFVYVDGTSGSFTLYAGGVSRVVEFTSSEEITCITFVGSYTNDFLEAGITLYYDYDSVGWYLSLEGDNAAGNFSVGAYPDQYPVELDGDIHIEQAYSASTPRIDTITLRGTEGEAWITCNTVKKEISLAETLTPTESWRTRDQESSEATELLNIIKDEVAVQSSRSKYMIDIRLQELPRDSAGDLIELGAPSDLNILGCFVDDLNVDESHTLVKDPESFTSSDCHLTYQDAQVQIDKILLSGVNGFCEFGTTLGVKEVQFTTSLYDTAEKWITENAEDMLNVNGIIVGMEVDDVSSDSDVSLVFIARYPGVGFTTVVNRTSGSLDGTVTHVQENASSSLNTYACYVTTNVDAYIHMDNLLLSGMSNKIISIRYKVAFGVSTGGRIVYSTLGHAISSSYYKSIGPLISDEEWHTLLLDMSDLTAGGDDWIESVITSIRFYITDDAPVVINLEWIGFARMFVINRGSFDVRNRTWQLDLIEIIK